MNPQKGISRFEIPIILLTPIIGMALGVGATFALGLDQTDFSNLIINLFMLAVVMVAIRIFKFSARDLGLKFIQDQAARHVYLSLAIFLFYLLIYIFVIRITALKPFSSATFWGLLTYLIVVVAEELYFRGALFASLEKRFSKRTALVASSILFGLFHARQGLYGIAAKSLTGWLWGSVRYSTNMIYLIIFPVHYAYNAVWLLFIGNWNNPSPMVRYGIPALEFLLGLAIIFLFKAYKGPNLEATE